MASAAADALQFWLDSSHSVSRNPPRCPGRLKIEAARDAVDVEEFSGKVEIRCHPAFHSFEIDLTQSHASASDELVLVERFSVDLHLRRAQLLNQVVHPGARQRSPDRFRKDAGV